MLGYRVPKPDEVMLVSGRKATEEEPFKIYRQGKFVLPGFRVARMLPMKQQKAKVEEPCTTKQGINGIFTAVVAFHIAGDDLSIYAAGQRFLQEIGVDRRTGLDAMAEQTGGIFAGHLRSIVGAMTLEEIMQQRQALADQVLDASKTEVAKMGLEIDSFQLTSIDGSQVQAYIAALAAPHIAARDQEARTAQAQSAQLAVAAEQESARKQAEYQRDTALKQAEYKAQTDKAEAEAAQAAPLAQAEAEQAVIDMQRLQAIKQAELREQQLVTEIQRPAEARAREMKILAAGAADQAVEQARQMTITAQATKQQAILAAEASAAQVQLEAEATAKGTQAIGQAEATKTRAIGLAEAEAELAKANAIAANQGAQLELAKINMMPEIARALASTWQDSTVTVLNGADGMAQLLASGAQQVKSLFDAFVLTDGRRTDEDHDSDWLSGAADPQLTNNNQ